ncbi:MAG: hypothetical protein WAX77_00080 [Methylococcaceae bacterium]
MIVEIKQDVFDVIHDFKGLKHLIQILTYKQRYQLFIEYSLVKNSNDYKKLDISDREEIEAIYNEIINSGVDINPKYFVSVNNHQENYFNIDEAIRFFSQPVSIILENSLNDQYFLLAIIKFFDDSKEIQKHLNNGWIQFENAGGCTNVENFINSKLQSFNNLALHYNKNNCIYLRCFILLDSDKEFSNAPQKYEYEKLLPFLTANNIKNHILEKRCMENYMPDEVYIDISSNNLALTTWFNAYRFLNSEQKDFLNIHNGFPKKDKAGNPIINRNDLPQSIQQLYVDVSESNYQILNKGFKLPNFKTEFPKNFDTNHQIHKSTLQARCGTNELQEIIDKIIELL